MVLCNSQQYGTNIIHVKNSGSKRDWRPHCSVGYIICWLVCSIWAPDCKLQGQVFYNLGVSWLIEAHMMEGQAKGSRSCWHCSTRFSILIYQKETPDFFWMRSERRAENCQQLVVWMGSTWKQRHEPVIPSTVVLVPRLVPYSDWQLPVLIKQNVL